MIQVWCIDVCRNLRCLWNWICHPYPDGIWSEIHSQRLSHLGYWGDAESQMNVTSFFLWVPCCSTKVGGFETLYLSILHGFVMLGLSFAPEVKKLFEHVRAILVEKWPDTSTPFCFRCVRSPKAFGHWSKWRGEHDDWPIGSCGLFKVIWLIFPINHHFGIIWLIFSRCLKQIQGSISLFFFRTTKHFRAWCPLAPT